PELCMQLRLFWRQRDRLAVSRACFGVALERGEGASKQDPAFDMARLLLKPRLELFGCGGELFGPVIGRRGCRGTPAPFDRRRRADRRIDGERRRRQQGRYTDRDAEATRGRGRAQNGRPRVL